MIEIYKMNGKGVHSTLTAIAKGLLIQLENTSAKQLDNSEHPLRIVAYDIVESLEVAAEDDAFGTEGWEHAFGLN